MWKKKELKLPAPLKSIAAYLAKRKWSTIQKYFLSEFNSEKKYENWLTFAEVLQLNLALGSPVIMTHRVYYVTLCLWAK